MMEFYAPQFVVLSQALAMTRMAMIAMPNHRSIGETKDDGLPRRTGLGKLLNFPKITALERELAEARRLASEAEKLARESAQELKAKNREAIEEALRGILPLISQMGMEFSLKEAERLSRQCVLRDLKPDEIEQLLSRLRDEIGTHIFFQLSPLHRKYYDPKEPLFGSEFEAKFPSAAFELDEAAKCFAFDRSTAAVFHLMRLVEIGVKALAACLNIPPPTKAAERNWGVILKSIKDSIGQRRWDNPEDKSFFESAYVSLDAIKNAWRNATMHVENKYTADEAEHIFNSVRGFMKKLSSRLDEAGEPKCQKLS